MEDSSSVIADIINKDMREFKITIQGPPKSKPKSKPKPNPTSKPKPSNQQPKPSIYHKHPGPSLTSIQQPKPSIQQPKPKSSIHQPIYQPNQGPLLVST